MGDAIYIDIDDGLKRVVNNKQLFVNLLKKFKNDANLVVLEEALKAGDLEKAKNSSHTLKGLSANLSLIELHKQSLEMETQIKAAIAEGKMAESNQIDILKNVHSETLKEIDKVIEQYE